MNTTEYTRCKICDGEIKIINKKHMLVECNSCGLIFSKTRFRQLDFVELYDKLYNSNDAKYKNYSVNEYAMLVNQKKIEIGFYRSKLLKKYVLNGNCGSVLEIGSGVGLVGSYIRSKNNKIKYLGVEIDKESFEKSQKLGLNTFNGDFTIIEKLDESFDVIMLWEVIEHLQDLNLFLSLAYKKLNDNGQVLLSTPNYNKIYNYLKRDIDRLYQDAPPIHLNFFTKTNIKSVFNFKGFFVNYIKVKKFPYLEINKSRFYMNCFKSIFGKYNGPTIFLSASKNEMK